MNNCPVALRQIVVQTDEIEKKTENRKKEGEGNKEVCPLRKICYSCPQTFCSV